MVDLIYHVLSFQFHSPKIPKFYLIAIGIFFKMNLQFISDVLQALKCTFWQNFVNGYQAGWQKIRHFTGTRKKAPQLHWVHLLLRKSSQLPTLLPHKDASQMPTPHTNVHKVFFGILFYTSFKIRKDWIWILKYISLIQKKAETQHQWG